MTRSLVDLVARQASERPGFTAIIDANEVVTYQALDERSSRLGSLLREFGVSRGSRVCLLLPKSADAVVAILGVLKTGACYVPLDPDSPASRIQRMVDSCDDRWLLADESTVELAEQLVNGSAQPVRSPPWTVGVLGEGRPRLTHGASFDWSDVEEMTVAALSSGESPVEGSDLAYVMFTSGSTGEPKGVPITHSNVISFLDWAIDYFGLRPGERVSSHSPLHFDLSVFDLFGSLAAGCELHLVPKKLNILPPALADFMRSRALNQWFSVPSVLNLMMRADCVAHGDFPELRRLIWCGEVLPTPTLIYFMERLPHVRFTNLYGPTEATIASSYYSPATPPLDPLQDVPIGRPCDGEDIVVLDEASRPLPVGEIGEIHISGAGLSPGYWRDPEKTERSFVQVDLPTKGRVRVYRTGDVGWRDEDGLIHFVGRSDSQIKSRGYRIELGEIEAALHSLDILDDAAVVAVSTGGFEGWTICCAYVPAEESQIAPATVRRRLREELPHYMIPKHWSIHRVLPTNANGKVDRPELRKRFTELLGVV